MHVFPAAKCFMVEPSCVNMNCGLNNFSINKFSGEFIKAFVDNSGFKIDRFVNERQLPVIDILHADIQGYEAEMIEGASNSLEKRIINYIFVSTHSQDLHSTVVDRLGFAGYRIEVSSDYDFHTTSCDGFVLASSPAVSPVFNCFYPLGRVDIANAAPDILVNSIFSAMKQS